MPDRRTVALTRRFQTRIAVIGGRAATLTVARWAGLSGYDEDDVATFAKLTTPTLTAAKASAVTTAVAFYSMLVGIRPAAITARDVPIFADPRDPFISYWRALKMGSTEQDAIVAGAARADAFARNLAADSSRNTAEVVMHRQGLRAGSWTRLPEPGACAWCEEVAAQTYSTADAASFSHGNNAPCHCTPVPNIA